MGCLDGSYPEPVKPPMKKVSFVEFGVNDVDSDADDEGSANEASNGVCEKIALEKEDDVIKKLIDPILPSQEEVDRHYIAGHVLYRNWCPICVRAKGREMDHRGGRQRETEAGV